VILLDVAFLLRYFQVAFRASDQLITAVGSEDIFDIRFNGVQQNLVSGVEYRLGAGALCLFCFSACISTVEIREMQNVKPFTRKAASLRA